MPSLSILMLWSFVGIVGLMFAGWIIGLIQGKVNLVDSLWGLGFVLAAWIALGLGSSADRFPDGRDLLIVFLTTAWGFRLAVHLFDRNYGKPEDKRYKAMRDKRPTSFAWFSLSFIYGLQALLLWVISWVILAPLAVDGPDLFTGWDVIGIALWLVGFHLETLADAQISAFKADPANRGKVMDQGLWGCSRHPNYFGECLVWWGMYCIALSEAGTWWTIVSPALITFLLLRISGVTMLEKHMEEERPEYADYKQRVNAFVPWTPKK